MLGSGMTILITIDGVGAVTSGVIVLEGSGYEVGDVLSITDSPGGLGATFTIVDGGVAGSQISPTYTPIPHGPI